MVVKKKKMSKNDFQRIQSGYRAGLYNRKSRSSSKFYKLGYRDGIKDNKIIAKKVKKEMKEEFGRKR